MNKYILPLTIAAYFLFTSTQTIAATEPYYATGEDIDNIIDGNNASGLFEIEERLNNYPLFCTLEEYFLNITYSTDEQDDFIHTVGDDE